MMFMDKGVDMSRYFTDLNPWIKDEEAFIKRLASLYTKLETSEDVLPTDLWTDVRQFTTHLFMHFTTRARLLYDPAFGDEHDEDLDQLMEMYKYLVATTYITDAKYGEVFTIAHSHAPGALKSTEYLECAESFLKGKLERWNIGKHHEYVYGLIFVGGKMAVYYMDKATKTFSRFLDGNLQSANSPPKPENWRPIVDVEVLKSLLGIFLQDWYRREEREFRAAVVCRMLDRMPLRGLPFEGHVAKMMQEQLSPADKCRLESALKECGIKRASENGEQQADAGFEVVDLGKVSLLDIGKRKSQDGDGSSSSSSKENSPNRAQVCKRQALDLAE